MNFSSFFMNRFLLFVYFCLAVFAQKNILITGNTQSYLEPCGCVEGMLGGIAKRPAAIKDHGDSILLDSGNFIDSLESLDLLRIEWYSKVFKAMDYKAVGLGDQDVRASYEFLKKMDSNSLFLSSNLKLKDGSYAFSRVFKIGEYNVISLLESDSLHGDFQVQPAIEAASDFKNHSSLILISSLKPATLEKVIPLLSANLVLVIANHSRGEFAKISGVPVIYPGEKGKFVKKFLISAGHFTSLPVKESYIEDLEIKKITDGFYQSVLNDANLQKMTRRFFEEYPQEKQVIEGKNSFVGSENCKTCHQKEYDEYVTTRHAHGMDSLLKVKKDFLPQCVQCHATGTGYLGGYEISKRQKHLQGIGCESCHGAGWQHIKQPSRLNIRAKVPKENCLVCHDKENSPGFDDAAYRPSVNHTTVPHASVVKKEIVTAQAVVDLFVMSQCPFGIKAENKILPMAKQYPQMKVNIHFIATDVEGQMKLTEEEKNKIEEMKKQRKDQPQTPGCNADYDLDPNAKFQSLHGKGEVDENIIQLIVGKLWPDKFFDFILERNKNIYSDWRASANLLGLDVKKIEETFSSGQGDQWFRENIRLGNERGISASPTVLLNGQSYEKGADDVPVRWDVCQSLTTKPDWCKNIAQCSADYQCIQKGKVGVCKDSGSVNAKCEFIDPIPVKLTILQDPDCTLCDHGGLLSQLFQVFPGIEATVLDKNTEKAQDWLKKTGSDRFPTFIFEDAAFQKSPTANRIMRMLAKRGEIFFVNPLVNEIASLNRPDVKKDLKLFYNPLAPSVSAVEDLVRVLREMEVKGDKISFMAIPLVSQSRKEAVEASKDPQLHLVNYSDGKGRTFPVYLQSPQGKKEITEGLFHLCVNVVGSGNKFLEYFSLYSGMMKEKFKTIKDQSAYEAFLAQLDLQKERQQIFQKMNLSMEEQRAIQTCASSDYGSQQLLKGLFQIVEYQAIMAPTLIVNDRFVFRGFSPKLLEILPNFLRTSKPWADDEKGNLNR